jgi:hypothetical protein
MSKVGNHEHQKARRATASKNIGESAVNIHAKNLFNSFFLRIIGYN